MNYKNSKLITLSLLVLVLLVLWIATSSLDDYRIAPLASISSTSTDTTTHEQLETNNPPGTPNSSIESAPNVSTTSNGGTPRHQGESFEQAALENQSNLARFDVLTEIGKRIAEEQYQEAENELAALVTSLDVLSDAEKSAFLDFYIDYTGNNAFEAEAVSAFDQLWSMLNMGSDLRLTSSRLLGLHYVESYELAFAIPLLENVIQSGGEIDASVLQNLSHAYFGMHQYNQAIPYLLQTIDFQFSQNQSVERSVFSELFEAYYRIGDMENAETVGVEILGQFNDIQDWKDMQQFYESTGNSIGLKTHMESARTRGFVSRDSQWIE